MRLLVVPFAADATDTDAHDLAAYLAGETAAELSEARLLVEVVPITRKGLGKAAARLGVETALGAKLRVEGGQVHVDALLVDAGGDRMPACLAALEQLAEARPEDAEVLLALGEYRALHFDAAGAREVLLRARDVAEDPAVSAKACLRLAALAEEAGRVEEAIMQ